jgi:hypothetical protein
MVSLRAPIFKGLNMWNPCGLVALMATVSAIQAPSVLINSGHAARNVTTDLLVLHPELNSAAGLGAIDNTCGSATTSAGCSANVMFDVTIASDTQSTLLANINVATSQYPVNHAPYVLVNNSFTGYSQTGWDAEPYALLQTTGVLMSWAYVGSPVLPTGTPPPLVSVTTTATSGPASLAGVNWGLEFGIPANYKGFDTSLPSWVTAAMTAVLAAMKIDHPSWNWFDIKAALRQTASNWSSGWNPAQFGYGAIDYNAATAISTTDALYLQPPVLRLTAGASGEPTLTLYPFRSARRAYEVAYVVPPGYVFPLKNELTEADMSNLLAAGGQRVFTGNGADTVPTGAAELTPSPGATHTLVAFTTDGAGAYSRVESWCPQSITDPPGSGPRAVADAPLPKWSYAVTGLCLLMLATRQRCLTSP